MIGPTHSYPTGSPIDLSDVGHINTAWRIHSRRVASLEFGTQLNWVCFTPETVVMTVGAIRDSIIRKFGNLRYDTRGLAIQVKANHWRQVVEWTFPHTMDKLTMSPESWLALSHRTFEVAANLRKH